MSTEERAFRFELFQVYLGYVETREGLEYGAALVASGYVFEDSHGFLAATNMGIAFLDLA